METFYIIINAANTVRHKHKSKSLFILFTMLCLAQQSFGQSVGDFQSHQSGNWNSTSTWERWNGASWITPAPYIPSSADGAITVLSPHNITVIADITVDQLTINSGATVYGNNTGVNIIIADGPGTDATINGILKNGVNWVPLDSIIINGQASVSSTGTFYNDTRSIAIVNGSLTVASGGTVVNGVGTGNALTTFTVNPGGIYTLDGSMTSSGGAGIYTYLNGTTLIEGNGSIVTGNAYIEIGGTTTITSTAASGGIQINANYSASVINGGALYIASGSAVKGSGFFVLESGGTLGIASPAGITTSGATGNIQSSHRTYDDGGHYIYNGTTSQVTGSGLPIVPITGSVRISNSSGVTLSDTLNVTGTLTVDASAILNAGTNRIKVTTISNSGTIRTQNTSATPIPTGKTWGGKFVLDAAGNQTLPLGTYNNVTFSTSGNKTFAGDIIINNNFVVNASAVAIIPTGSFGSVANTLTLGGSGKASGTWGGSNALTADFMNGTWFGFVTNGYITILNNTGSWVGTVSIDWNDANNWAGEVVPVSTTDVTITTATFMPTLNNTTTTIHNLTMNGPLAALIVSGSSALTVAGTASLLSGNINTQDGATITFANDLTISNGFNIGESGTSSITGTGSNTINSSGGLTLIDGSSFNSTGAFTNSGTLSLNNTCNLSLSSTFTTTGTVVANDASNVVFNGSGVVALPAVTYANLTINKSGNPAITASGNITVNGILDLTNGTLDMNSKKLTLAGDITRTSGDLNASGSTSEIAFTNTSAISLPSGVFSSNVNNLTMNGSGGVTTNSAFTIDGSLTLTIGKIYTAGGLIILSATGSATSGNSNSYIDGPIKKIGGTDFVFPTGNGGKWARIGISGTTIGTDAYTATYFASGFGDYSVLPLLTNVSTKEYWTVDRAAGVSATTVTLYFEDGSFSGITSLATSDLVVAHYNGSDWEDLGLTRGNSGTTSAGTVSMLSVNSFSPFTFGSPNGLNPLPVKLLNFTAKAEGNNSLLYWRTATEKNNDYFNIERSTDGVNFTEVGERKGAGNSTNIINYSFNDYNVPIEGISLFYYRLQQVDFNGKFEYSNIAAVNFGKGNTVNVLTVQPNPFAEQFSLNYELPDAGIVNIRITDALGRILASNETSANKGVNTMEFNTADYAKGLYFINVAFNGTNTNYKMVVKE